MCICACVYMYVCVCIAVCMYMFIIAWKNIWKDTRKLFTMITSREKHQGASTFHSIPFSTIYFVATFLKERMTNAFITSIITIMQQ